MSGTTRTPTVILALDRQPERWAVETAFTLARQLHARLDALFVENLNLLRLAQLPFSQEIASLTAQSRPLATTGLEQAMRSQANQLQQLLTAQAELQQIEWRFSVVRDYLLRAVCHAGQDADLFIMQGTPMRAFAADSVAALFDGTMEAIDTAARLAQGNNIHILLTSRHDGSRHTISARLRFLAIQPLFVTLADDRVTTLRAVVKRHHLTTLVIPAALLHENQQLLQPLIDEIPCTVAVMPATNTNMTLNHTA